MADVDLTIGADTSAAAAGFAELKNYAEKARADITSTFAGSLGIFGVIAGFDSLIEKLHQISHESERFGIDPEQLQLVANAAAEAGIPLEAVARALNLLGINGAKALSSTSAQAQALRQLGIDAAQFNSLNPAEKFFAIATAYQASAKSGEDYAAAAKLIGTRNTEMLALLGKTPAELEAAARAMGIFDTATLGAGDSIYKLQKQLLGLAYVDVGGPLLKGISMVGAAVRDTAELVYQLWNWFAKLTTLDFSGATAAGNKMLDVFKLQGPGFQWLQGVTNPKSSARPDVSPVTGAAAIGTETSPEGVPFTDEGEGGSAASIGDLSARDASSGAASGGGGAAKGLSNELSLRQKIAQIEEETAARGRSDEEQLAELQKQRVDLSQRYGAASKASDFTDTKESLEAELALAKNQQEIDKVSGKIEDDKAAAADKITKEREKQEAQAAQSLADAQESNKEIAFELAGRKDLADRAKIQYDYEQKIADAKNLVAYDEEQARAAAEAGDQAEQEKWLAVANTNRALVDQLSLEEKNALAAHDKAEAEKQAAAVIEAKGKLTSAQESLGAVDERAKELQLELAGETGKLDLMKTELQYDKQITKSRDDANDLWTQMADAYRQGNVAAGDLLAKAAQLKDIEADRLGSEKEIAVLLQQQAAGLVALGRGGDAGQVRQLAPGQSVSGYDQFGRPVVKNAAGGGDLTIAGLASGNLRMEDTAFGLARLESGGA